MHIPEIPRSGSGSFAAVPVVNARPGEVRRGEREQSGMVCYTKEGQPDSPTARQPDSPTARQPDSPTARQPDSPTARHY